jgi:hypothetical protein
MTADTFESIQLSLPDGKKILAPGHQYQDPITGIDMLEFHVDDHDCRQDFGVEKFGTFGGSVSIHRPEGSKPIIVFGQDESVFNQFSFNGKLWTGPSGKQSILPKNDGLGVMVSVFQSQELGFGVLITEEQLKKINKKRKEADYFYVTAANKVNSSTKKQPLTKSPFVHLFEFGGQNGYWTGNHMTLQSEDCIDRLKEIYGYQYDFVFLFNHSSGHAKKRAGGLDVKKMLKGFGGDLLRNTTMERHDGYLGPFHNLGNP